MAHTAQRPEELKIFVEHLMDFMNLWTIYTDYLSGKYVPSLDPGGKQSRTGMHVTLIFHLYASLFSLVEDSSESLNAFRIWRKHFPHEEAAITAVEQQIAPFKNDLRVFRNRLGFHGSRTRSHEAQGWDLFANASGTTMWNAMINFKGPAPRSSPRRWPSTSRIQMRWRRAGRALTASPKLRDRKLMNFQRVWQEPPQLESGSAKRAIPRLCCGIMASPF